MMTNTYSLGNNLLVLANSMLEQNLVLTLEQAILGAQEQLQAFASAPEFGQKIELTFGSGTSAQELRKAWLAGDFSQLPRIEIRSAREINGANGAFAEATNTIYLAQEYLNQNVGSSEEVTRVLLEEIGHFVDSRINTTDTLGDEGQIFSAIVSNQTLAPEQLQVIRSEDDSTLINLDGQAIQVEQSVPNQVLWSQRIGKSIEDTFSIGSLVGLPNAKTWNTQDIFGQPLRSLGLGSLIKNDVLGLDTAFGPISIPALEIPTISLGGAVSASANAKLSIAGPNNSSQPANIKAGLQVDAGYDLGKVKWNLPLFADTSLAVKNGYLDFQSNFDKRGAFFDYISPYFKLGIKGIFESKAAAYITGGASLEYIDIWETLWSWEERTETQSVGFNEKIPLSAKLTHQFVDFDTRKSKQTIDWIAGSKTYQLTESGAKSDPIPLGKYLDFGFNIPNLNNIDFKQSFTSDGYKFSASAKAKNLISFDLKLDDIIADKLPIPTSISGGEEYSIFGKTFGYNYNASLFEASLKVALDADFTVDFTISDLQPKLFIDGEALDKLKIDINNLPATYTTIEKLDKNKDKKLDLEVKFDPLLTANVNSFLTPTINLTTGIGKVAFDLKPFDIGFDKLLLPISNGTKSLGKFDLLSAPLFSKRFSQLDDLIAPNINLASLLNYKYKSQIDTVSLNKAIDPDLNIYDGTSAPDYFPGTSLNDKPLRYDDDTPPGGLRGGPDVAQLSPGEDDLDGGSQSYSNYNQTSYLDPFGNEVFNAKVPDGDVFILDSDLSVVHLTPGKDSIGSYLELKDLSPFDATKLRNFERLVVSDEKKSSTEGLSLNFLDLDIFDYSKPRLYIGGLPKRDAYSPAAPLPTTHLTTTQGRDYLSVPIGYNDVPYILGDGDDIIELFQNRQASTPNAKPNRTLAPNERINWVNPYGYNQELYYGGLTQQIYQDVIDLGDSNASNVINGRNVVLFGVAPTTQPYDAFISSIAGNNLIRGDLSSVDTLRIVNLGGAVFLNADMPQPTGEIFGLFSGGEFNTLSVGQNQSPKSADLTFVLEKQTIQKFGVDPNEFNEIEVEVKGKEILYRLPNITFERFDTIGFPADRLTLASADLAGSTILKEMGSDERYSLESPAKQTYIIGNSTAVKDKESSLVGDGILVRGRLPQQKGAYRKVVLKNDINSRTTIGKSGDIFDEIVFEGRQPFDTPFLVNPEIFNINTVNFQKIDFTGVNDFTSKFNRLFPDVYLHEVSYSEKADVVENVTEDYLQNLQNLKNNPSFPENTVVPPLTSPFQNSPFARYGPLVTHLLGDGDDVIKGIGSSYEFFYPGAGNNFVINTVNRFGQMAYEPGTNDSNPGKRVAVSKANDTYTGPTGPIFGDVVVYTEGNRSNYTIQRSQLYPDAIEVIKTFDKPDGSKETTKDTLFGVSLIKFETEDASLISVPDSITAPAPTTQVDIFDNDLKSRLFYSQVIRPDGDSFEIQLDNNWAVDRVDLTQQVIHQPGAVPATWNYDIPVGLTEFNLTKAFLLKEFKDPDISVKNLYTLNDLTISDLKVTQKVVQGDQTIDVTIPIETLGEQWLIKSTNPITLESFPFEISYIITEPEGYSHLVRLNLNPSEVISLQDLRTVFQAGIFNNEFNGSSGNDNIDGSDEAETIRGNSGQNIIYGGAGDDQLFGGNDSDFISGDPGSDTIEGGSGDDIIDGDATLAESVALALGTESSTSTSASANDVINGGDGDDIILGGIGDDRLIPGKGNDLIEGGEGTDTGVSSGASTDYRIRKRLDGSVVVIDERTTDNEGVELYRETENFEFSDRTFTYDEVQTSSGGAAAFNEAQSQVTIQTSEQNLELKTVEGSKIVSIDIPSLEDLLIDKVLLAKSLAVLENYRNSKGEKFNASSSVLEFLVQTPDTSPKEVIEFKLAQEQDADTFIKIKPSTGETFEFNYNPTTGTGAELIDSNGNGLVDLVKIHLKDGDVGDADGEINGVIYDPGMLAKRVSNGGSDNNPPPDGGIDDGGSNNPPAGGGNNNPPPIRGIELLSTTRLPHLDSNLLFDSTFYLNSHLDVAAAIQSGAFRSAFEHFSKFGFAEGRSPSAVFASDYLTKNQDVAAAVTQGFFKSGFEHFIKHGMAEGRDPSSGLAPFDMFYLAENPDVAQAINQGFFKNGLEHLIHFGMLEGRDPMPRYGVLAETFDPTFYSANNSDVAEAVQKGFFRNSFEHFIKHGMKESRNPSLLFNNNFYLTQNSDVAAAVNQGFFKSGFEHFMKHGMAEGRVGATIVGSAAADRLEGNAGVNIIDGSAGNDTIVGGGGNDFLIGGAGNDLFALGSGTGVDAIADFQLGQDKLGLSGGLRFEQLAIAQGTGTHVQDTFIHIAANDELLAIVSNVPASSLADTAFTLV